MEAPDTTGRLSVGEGETDVIAVAHAGLDTAFVRQPDNKDTKLTVSPPPTRSPASPTASRTMASITER